MTIDLGIALLILVALIGFFALCIYEAFWPRPKPEPKPVGTITVSTPNFIRVLPMTIQVGDEILVATEQIDEFTYRVEAL